MNHVHPVTVTTVAARRLAAATAELEEMAAALVAVAEAGPTGANLTTAATIARLADAAAVTVMLPAWCVCCRELVAVMPSWNWTPQAYCSDCADTLDCCGTCECRTEFGD